MQYNSPSGQHLAQAERCTFVETSLNPNTSIFPNVWMVFLDFSLNVLKSHVLLKLAMTESVRDWYAPSLESWSPSTASCGTTGTRRSIFYGSPSTRDCSRLDCHAGLAKNFSKQFSELVVAKDSFGTNLCLLWCSPLSRCNQLVLSRKR